MRARLCRLGLMLAAIAGIGVAAAPGGGHGRRVGGPAPGGAALLREIAWLLAAAGVIYALRVAWRLVLFSASYRLGVELRQALYRRLTLQPPVFFQARRTGDLMALATNDVDAVELAAGEGHAGGFDGTLTLVLVVATMTLAWIGAWRRWRCCPSGDGAGLLVDLAPCAHHVAGVVADFGAQRPCAAVAGRRTHLAGAGPGVTRCRPIRRAGGAIAESSLAAQRRGGRLRAGRGPDARHGGGPCRSGFGGWLVWHGRISVEPSSPAWRHVPGAN